MDRTACDEAGRYRCFVHDRGEFRRLHATGRRLLIVTASSYVDFRGLVSEINSLMRLDFVLFNHKRAAPTRVALRLFERTSDCSEP